MSTLSDQSPLSKLARILHAAASLGSGAWDAGEKSASGDSPADENRLADDLVALFRLLDRREIDYMLVGGVALLRYIDGRNTDDIDLILAVEAPARIPELIIEDRNPDIAKGSFRSLRVDLLFTSNPVFRIAKEQYATVHRFAEIDVCCATVEGLALLKLYALPALYQQGDLQRAALYENDIMMLFLQYHPDLRELAQKLKPHRTPGEVAELYRIIDEIERRAARMQGRKDQS